MSSPIWLNPLIVLFIATSSAQAAPFSMDPVSFAGFANNVKWSSGNSPFFKNLGNCEQVANGGYICNSGQVYLAQPNKPGRKFCDLTQVWYEPNTKSVQYKTKTCQFKGDEQRLQEQGYKLIQKGLNILENYSR
jgi:hypothetical protein